MGLLDRDGIATWVRDAPTITDEHPWMEFFLHQGGNMKDEDIAPLLAVDQGDFGWLGDTDSHFRHSIKEENAALRLYVDSKVSGNPAPGVAAGRQSRATEFFLYPHGCTTLQREALRSGRHEVSPAEVAGRLKRCTDLFP